jgi:predicted alpha/beta superfamily hydrolase
MKKPLIVLFLTSLLISCNRELANQTDQFIYIGKKESIHSKILDEDRPFWVYVPPYERDSGKKFSVLYLLDGDAHFHSVSGLIQILGTGVNGTNVIPEMIVVGIPNTDRTRDLTPSHSMAINGEQTDFLKTSGGGDKFLSFMKDELIPYIESAYPTHPYRVLVGHSFGGIATINALYTMPETFDAYVAIDPSLWWDQQLLLKKADSIFSTRKLDDKYLFLGQANTLNPGESTNDHFGSIKEYVNVLESPSNTSGIRWSYKYYPDDSHGSVPFITEYDGLRFIYHDFSPDYHKIGTDPELLKKHFAQYRLPIPESVINRFGYMSIAAKDLNLAQRYFEMNIEAYPQSSNVYDSMGELMLNKGDTTRAMELYKKSLELDPNNTNASKVIKDILERQKNQTTSPKSS